MTISELLKTGEDMWPGEKLTLPQIIVRLGKIFGDICRYERNAQKDHKTHTSADIQKELGNLIFNTILWSKELGFDPKECIKEAVDCQTRFLAKPDIKSIQMDISDLRSLANDIWHNTPKLTIEEFIIIMGKVFGDICRWQRGAGKDTLSHTDQELEKELGNFIFTPIRCADHLGFDPLECIKLAIDSQAKIKESLLPVK
jgi:hypothetical protein